MKLKINKACDLNSISVLPPQSRRSSMLPAQQPRSQPSQQSFSQGISQSALFSQISQNSFDEHLTDNQRFGSQEKDNSVKRISCLAPVSYPRDESQMPISRTSSNMTRRWSAAAAAAAPAPDQKCQLSAEIEHKFGAIETLLSRLGMILDSIQADIMQVNKGTKELSLAVEGIRQKSIAQDDSLHQLDTSLRTISNQLSSISHEKMQEIVAAVMKMQDQIQASVQNKSDELSTRACQDELKFTLDTSLKTLSNQFSSISHEKMQEIVAAVMKRQDQNQASVQKKIDEFSTCLSGELQTMFYSLKTLDHKQLPLAILPRKVTGANSSSLKPIFERKPEPIKISKQAKHAPKTETTGWTTVKPEPVVFSNRNGNSCRNLKQRRFSPLARKQNVFVSLDDESDEDFSCFIVEKESGNVSEVDEETERILRRARRRKRKQSCKR